MNKFILLFCLYIMINPTIAYAYLDPGTGSIILQAIIGFIAATITAISVYWIKFKSMISKIFLKKKKKENFDKTKLDD